MLNITILFGPGGVERKAEKEDEKPPARLDQRRHLVPRASCFQLFPSEGSQESALPLPPKHIRTEAETAKTLDSYLVGKEQLLQVPKAGFRSFGRGENASPTTAASPSRPSFGQPGTKQGI
ncbi:hypothetical protein E2320_014962 [Naja naja]|nr:hypothetical protein E2320_014951 [Naja naja]KAG8128082.1 hypothetical protein E2320_014962 [Naja naja]